MTLHLFESDPALLDQELSDRIAQAPNFFHQAPVVVDVSALDASDTLAELIKVIRARGLLPIAARTLDDDQQAQMNQLGMPSLRRHQADESLGQDNSPEDDAEAPAVESIPGLTIERMVRSGQQVYAKQGDLVVVGGTSPGSELIADGNIHVYGRLRGRAICGINGSKSARIFCSSLEAELVSVAGVYCLLEAIPDDLRGKPAQIIFNGEQLTIQGL